MVILNKNSDEHLRPETLMEGSHFWTEKNSFLDREGSLDKWDGNSSTRAPATHLPPDAQVNYTNEFERQIQHFFKWLETVFIQSTQCHQSVEIDEERFNLYFSQKKKLFYIFFPYHDKWSGWKVGASNQSSSTVFFSLNFHIYYTVNFLWK